MPKEKMVREGTKRFADIAVKSIIRGVAERSKNVTLGGGDIVRITTGEADLLVSLARRGIRN